MTSPLSHESAGSGQIRTRRALLGGLVGGVAAAVAGAVGRASPARAAAGDPIRMGRTNMAGGTNTQLQTNSAGPAYRVVQNGTGVGLRAESAAGHGLVAVGKKQGVFAISASNTATGTGLGGAIEAIGNQNNAIVASSLGDTTIRAFGNTTLGVRTIEAYTPSSTGTAIYGRATAGTESGIGLYGQSDTPVGVGVQGVAQGSGACRGVWGYTLSDNGIGGLFQSFADNGVALRAQGTGSGRNRAVLQVHNSMVGGGAMSAYMTANTNFATAHLRNDGNGQVLYLHNGGTDAAGTGGGDFITAMNNPESDAQFRVLTSGEVRSDVGFNTPAADFAEMLDAEPGLEPGDVLAIGADGRLARSERPHQESLAGVYSTQPGFVGGKPVDGALDGHVPLAVVGIVPVKASAENGAILPGDLLTSSATPGHAMRANGDARVGCVIGKALEPIPAGTGRIRMLVVLQ